MRRIDRIFIHATAGWQTQTVEDLKAEFRAKGWKNPGYHYVVMPDGRTVQLLGLNGVSNGVYGYNANAINVAYVGGITKDLKGRIVPTDNRTPQQKRALRVLLLELRKKFPTAKIMGHRSIWGEDTPRKWLKTCPNFNAVAEYRDI